MATFEDIGRGFGGRISSAIARDGFSILRAASAYSLPGSHVVAELKAIARELDGDWTVDQRTVRLTAQQKAAIIRAAATELGLDRADWLEGAMRCASNDAYMELVDYISKITKRS